ncbi:MAG: restriction endonuclease subunit S [Lachnospiraceae bacterium]|nr:restriction endonuclease subunit S [Lachnospiraceae bacterium]
MEIQNATLASLSVDGRGSYGIGASAVERSEDLYTYLRITDIRDDGTLNMTDLKSVDDDKAAQYLLKPNDIVFARTGASTGRNYFYDGTDGEFVYAGFLIKFSIDPNKVNPKYVKYYCLSDAYRGWIHSFNTGSTRGNINAQTLGGMPVPIPPRPQQDGIVDILSSIDEKIRKNTEVNENLTEQARAVFQAWFIDYEPFGGVAPSDWHPSTLGQIAEMKTDSWSPANNPNVVVEHYSIPAFDEQHFPVFEIASGIKSNKYLLNSNSVMISKLNPGTKRIWRPMCLSAHPVCSTEFIVYEAKKQDQRDYIYSILDSVPFLNHLCSHTTGSTNSRQRATPKSTLDFTLCLPPDSVIEDFCQIVTPMYDLIASNIVENQSLAKVRDNLLPRLMYGELDVSCLDL